MPMSTHVFDDRYDATIRPINKLGPGRYRCEVIVGLRTGEFTNSAFTAEGTTENKARFAALELARNAIASGKIEY